jgi:hypothetical protein
MTRRGRSESPRRFGRIGVVIVAALLAGPPAGSGGCARCGASTPGGVTDAASTQPAGSNGSTRPFVSDEARPQRWTREARTVAVGESDFVCVRACDGGFFRPLLVDCVET